MTPVSHRSFSQQAVARCTGADDKTINNYVHGGYLKPVLVGGRRQYPFLEMLKAEVIFRLADLFRIAPGRGALIADRIIAAQVGVIERDAQKVGEGRWPHQGEQPDAQLTIVRRGDDVEIVDGPIGDDDAAFGVTLVFPLQMFARRVMQAADLEVAEA